MSKTVLISAGHSNKDPGAVNRLRTESQVVVQMRAMVAHYLDVAGIDYITDGKGKRNAPLSEAIQLAKKSDLAIEFHCNASTNKTAKGVEVLAAEKHKALSQKLAAAVSRIMGNPLRGDKGYKTEGSGQHSRLGFISSGGGLIVELFFISNDAELAVWDAKCWLVAREVAQVIIDYMEY